MKGLILAGGRSTRFGSDKTLAVYEGKTFIEKAVLFLESVDLEAVIVTRPGTNYSFLKCKTIYDLLPQKGPLGGIYTAMSFFRNTSFLVLSCDMPALTRDALEELLNQHEPSRQLTFYSTPDKAKQPFPGIYEASLFDIIEYKINYGDLSMHGLLEAVPQRKKVQWQGNPAVFHNINYKEDLFIEPV